MISLLSAVVQLVLGVALGVLLYFALTPLLV